MRSASGASSKNRRSAEASRYDAGSYVWNSGMFCFDAADGPRGLRAARARAARRRASVWQRLRKDANSTDAGNRRRAVRTAVPEISFDVAVMEKAQNVRRRPRRVRLERRRLLASGVGAGDTGCARKPRRKPRAKGERSEPLPPATPTSMPGTASSPRLEWKAWSSSTRPTRCWSRTATSCSASRKSSRS